MVFRAGFGPPRSLAGGAESSPAIFSFSVAGGTGFGVRRCLDISITAADCAQCSPAVFAFAAASAAGHAHPDGDNLQKRVNVPKAQLDLLRVFPGGDRKREALKFETQWLGKSSGLSGKVRLERDNAIADGADAFNLFLAFCQVCRCGASANCFL